MIRLLLIGLAVFVVILLLRRIKGGFTSVTADSDRLESSTMVKCAYCQLHVPESEAIKSAEQYFCSAEHKILEQQDEK